MVATDAKPRLKRDWIGRKVRTLVELKNGYVRIPAGTVMTVTYSRAGLSLESDPCEHCGVRASVNRVSERGVELLS